MPNTYTQIHIHFVFAVKNRHVLVHDSIRIRIEKYITGIIQNMGHKVLAIYCMPDHTHMLIDFKPDGSMSDLMREVKSRSTDFINKERLTKEMFSWQEGYGAFSYSKSHVENVIDYILNQPLHHKKKSFREEYLEFLERFEISYKQEYLFNWLETGSTPTEPQVNI